MTAKIANPEIENIGQHDGDIELADDCLRHGQRPCHMGNRNNVSVAKSGLGHETEVKEGIKIIRESIDPCLLRK